MHKPWHSLLFGIALFAILMVPGMLFKGVPLFVGKDLSVTFPTYSSLFTPAPKKADITAVFEALNRVDTTFRIDKPEESVDTVREARPKPPLNLRLQYRDGTAMNAFFSALSSLRNNGSGVRVLHYGDSQIEGDRMTGFLREKLQAQFGGAGPGLLSFMPLSPVPGCRAVAEGSWERYSVFTAKDSRVQHSNYGVRASFCRFRPYRPVSDTTRPVSATLKLECKVNLGIDKLRLLYGNSKRKTWCEFYDADVLMFADSLLAGGNDNVLELPVKQTPATLKLKFRGLDSPDFYAVSLEGGTGIMVDNIAMRGSSGTFFHHINREQLKKFYTESDVRLIILQFGGNALPAIEDTAMARNYAEYMRYQVRIVKKLAPGASILFIGPSDMSVKLGTEYVTYPMLEPVRDNLRRVVLEEGCAYFDMYDAMGGYNSMPVWVEEKLAGSDYTHFTPRGARKISAALYAAIIEDYNKYLRSL